MDAAFPTVCYAPRFPRAGPPECVFHAKVILDNERLVVVSGSPTQAARNGDTAVGTLSRDRAIAGTPWHHFKGLSYQGLLDRPSEA